jgi:hypothetical protein
VSLYSSIGECLCILPLDNVPVFFHWIVSPPLLDAGDAGPVCPLTHLDAGELEVDEAVHGGGALVGEVVRRLEGGWLFAPLSHNPRASRHCMAECHPRPAINVHWIL